MLHADLLLVNGRLFTNTTRRATALALRGDRLLAVGRDEEILDLRGPRTQVIDLQGRLATPGLTDAHVHLNGFAVRLAGVRLETARTLAEALRRVATRVGVTPKGEWIDGGGFNKNAWGGDFPTRHDLDAVAPDHPVALHAQDCHTLWVNTLALQRCGITRHTRVGGDGIIRRDEQGEPTGLLQESAMGLVYGSPAYTAGTATPEQLRQALRHFVRLGITSLHVMEEVDTLGPLQELREREELAARVTVYPYYTELGQLVAARLRSGFGDEWLRLGGVKLMLDGTLGSQTAWLYEPHENSDAGGGMPLLTGEELRGVLRQAAEHGLAVAVHAIGDRANAEALDAFADSRHFGTPLPHRMEHAQLLRPEDWPRFAELGVIASMQPSHILNDAASAERYWGARSRWAYPFRSLLRAGATLAFGSDAPVETPDPIVGLDAAVTRTPRGAGEGTHWYPGERLTVAEALRAYTLGPALASGESEWKGRLAPGCVADVVVFSEDLFARGVRPREARVDLVVLAGRIRHRRTGGI